ncbi:MAG TPA: hypothetical protein VIP11_25255 [Gemmatimonadaceae bacterium]
MEAANAHMLHLPIRERAKRSLRGRRMSRRRVTEREAQRTLVPTADRRDDSLKVGTTEEWEAIGAEALCMLHLSPAEVAAAVDRDLSMSATWLVGALGRAMDER